jgi:Arc/MetJ-type ribon-helix-helix transcriptional regulator
MTDDTPEEMEEVQQNLRAEFLGRASVEGFGLRKREISVMTRMSTDIVDVLDALVELEIFKSRSEAVAALIERAIYSRKTLFTEIRSQASDIKKKREAARHLAQATIQAMKEEADSEE